MLWDASWSRSNSSGPVTNALASPSTASPSSKPRVGPLSGPVEAPACLRSTAPGTDVRRAREPPISCRSPTLWAAEQCQPDSHTTLLREHHCFDSTARSVEFEELQDESATSRANRRRAKR
jgi:hypothetical protein